MLDRLHISISCAVSILALVIAFPLAANGQENRGNDLPEKLWGLLQNRQYSAARADLSRLAEAGNQQAQFILANYYVCGRVVEFDCSKALSLFVAATRPSKGTQNEEIIRRAKNEIAWINSACEQSGFKRDTDIALKLALEASKDSDPYSMDSLAATFARRGDFTAAVRAQQQAIDGLVAYAASGSVEPHTFTEFRSRLKLYQSNKPASFGKWNAEANCNALP